MPSQVNISTASQLFDPTVTVIAQNSQYLKNTIKERHGTTGDATNVPVSDILEMQDIGFAATDITVTPVNNTNNLVIPFNYGLKTVIGGGYKTLFAYDTIVDQMVDHGYAVGRNDDFIKINSLFNATNFGDILVVPFTVGFSTGLCQEKITQGLAYLGNAGWDVSNMQCSLWVPFLQKIPFFQDPTVVNYFYNDAKPLSNNKTNNYLDVDIRFLGATGINSIPFTSSMGIDTYLVPLVHTNSMVQTYNRDPASRVNWLDWEDRYDLLSTMTSGSQLIQATGVVLLECQFPFEANTAETLARGEGKEPMKVRELLRKRGQNRPKPSLKGNNYKDQKTGEIVPVLKPASGAPLDKQLTE